MEYLKLFKDYSINEMKEVDDDPSEYILSTNVQEMKLIVNEYLDKIGIKYKSQYIDGSIVYDSVGRGVGDFSFQLSTPYFKFPNYDNLRKKVGIIIPLLGADGGYFKNMDRFSTYLANCYNINIGDTMLKINESSNREFPDDFGEFKKIIDNYLNKIGIKYDCEEEYGHGKSIVFRYKLFGVGDGKYFSIYTHTDPNRPIFSSITAWGVGEMAIAINNMREFVNYLTDISKIDMRKVMLKVNENDDHVFDFPDNMPDFTELIDSELIKFGIEFEKYKNDDINLWYYSFYNKGEKVTFSLQQVQHYQFSLFAEYPKSYDKGGMGMQCDDINAFHKFLMRINDIDMKNVMKKINESHGNEFPDDIKVCAEMVKKKLSEVGIRYELYTTSNTNDEVINYRLYTKNNESVIIGIEHYKGIKIFGGYPKSYEEKHRGDYRDDHTFLSESKNWDEFFYYLTQINNLDQGDVMLKMNENNYNEFSLPTDIEELTELICNYLDKFKIEYSCWSKGSDHSTVFIEGEGDKSSGVLYLELKIGHFTSGHNPEGSDHGMINPLIGDEYIDNKYFTNITQFQDYLVKLYEIDTLSAVKNINETIHIKGDISEYTFPRDRTELDEFINNHLTKMNIRFKRSSQEYNRRYNLIKTTQKRPGHSSVGMTDSIRIAVEEIGYYSGDYRGVVFTDKGDCLRNVEELNEFLVGVYEIDTIGAIKKIHESTTIKLDDFTFPDNLREFDKVIHTYMSKLGIDFRLKSENDHSKTYNLYSKDSPEIIGRFMLSTITTIRGWKGLITTRGIDHIVNLESFSSYLAKVYGIDMGNVMKKMNEWVHNDKITLPQGNGSKTDDLEDLVNNYLGRLGLEYDIFSEYNDLKYISKGKDLGKFEFNIGPKVDKNFKQRIVIIAKGHFGFDEDGEYQSHKILNTIDDFSEFLAMCYNIDISDTMKKINK
tara:strand:+ start:1493 stop:4312 length:2820 start_codon:yes stop_codon:yes gene_type:complete